MLGLDSPLARGPDEPSDDQREQDREERVEARRRVEVLSERVAVLTIRLTAHVREKH